MHIFSIQDEASETKGQTDPLLLRRYYIVMQNWIQVGISFPNVAFIYRVSLFWMFSLLKLQFLMRSQEKLLTVSVDALLLTAGVCELTDVPETR